MNLQRVADTPVRDVTFGTALQISLDHYYDLLKKNVGALKAEEYIQLKLVADTIDLSEDKKASEGGYTWLSYYNLLNRSDRAIEPIPVAGEIQIGLEALASHFERFLRRLRNFVVVKVLTPEEQLAVADLDKAIESLKKDATAFYIQDKAQWNQIADAMGFNVGDWGAYLQWSANYGHIRDIERLTNEIKTKEFQRKTILDRKYPSPEDQEVIDAEFAFENPLMRLRYPIQPDFVYEDGDKFSPTYLARLPLGSSALYDDRRAVTWDKTLNTIKTGGAGGFKATLDKSTKATSSITTDWSVSGSSNYLFIRVHASSSEYETIQEEFYKGEAITLSAQAAMRINMATPGWFRPTLFKHKHVLANPFDFQEFFGLRGTLLYYPTALIVVRGFQVSFESSQEWKFDYEKRFSASGGGGFNVFNFGFGSRGSYNQHVKEHRLDKSKTTLTIGDDKDTLRFVGYAVKKNDVLTKTIETQLQSQKQVMHQ